MKNLVFMFLFVSGCTSMCHHSREEMTPEQVVEAYLDVALNMQDLTQREALLDYTTGNLREAIANASDDMIKQAYIDKNYKLENYSVVERRDRTPRETEITFILTYRDLGESDKTAVQDAVQIKTENTVSVVNQKQRWLIRDVLGKKSSFDFPLAQGAEIKASAPTEEGR